MTVADALSVEDTAAWTSRFSHLWRRNTSCSFFVQPDKYYIPCSTREGLLTKQSSAFSRQMKRAWAM